MSTRVYTCFPTRPAPWTNYGDCGLASWIRSRSAQNWVLEEGSKMHNRAEPSDHVQEPAQLLVGVMSGRPVLAPAITSMVLPTNQTAPPPEECDGAGHPAGRVTLDWLIPAQAILAGASADRTHRNYRPHRSHSDDDRHLSL